MIWAGSILEQLSPGLRTQYTESFLFVHDAIYAYGDRKNACQTLTNPLALGPSRKLRKFFRAIFLKRQAMFCFLFLRGRRADFEACV